MTVYRGTGMTTAQLQGAYKYFIHRQIDVLYISRDGTNSKYNQELMCHLYRPSEAKHGLLRYCQVKMKFHSLTMGIGSLRGTRNFHTIYDHDAFNLNHQSPYAEHKINGMIEFTKHMNQRTKEKYYGQHNQ